MTSLNNVIGKLVELVNKLKTLNIKLERIILRVEGFCKWAELYSPPIIIDLTDVDNVRKAIESLISIVSGSIFEKIKTLRLIFELSNSEKFLSTLRELNISNIGGSYVEYTDNRLIIIVPVSGRNVEEVVKSIESCISNVEILLDMISKQLSV